MNYENIRLEKGMYSGGRSFSQILEELDPTIHYAGTELGRLDAFQRQLKRFDIKVSGRDSDSVHKFFATTDSAALFPEYVSRAVRAGIDSADLLPHVVATTTNIEGMDYRTITSNPSEEQKSFKRVQEGTAIPQTVISTQENLVKLNKRGRMLVASYEALKFQRLDLFTVALKQIGSYIAREQFQDAVNVLIEGDGNDNPAEVVDAAASGTLNYDDLLRLWNKFDPYDMSALIASPDVMMQLLQIDEFKNPNTGLNFQATGQLTTPMGAGLVKSTAVPAGKLIGLDKSCALEMVVASDVLVDYDKLIDRQIERAAVTSIAGFAKIYPDAVKVLRI